MENKRPQNGTWGEGGEVGKVCVAYVEDLPLKTPKWVIREGGTA